MTRNRAKNLTTCKNDVNGSKSNFTESTLAQIDKNNFYTEDQPRTEKRETTEGKNPKNVSSSKLAGIPMSTISGMAMEVVNLDVFPLRTDKAEGSNVRDYKKPTAKPESDSDRMLDVFTIDHNAVANGPEITIPEEYTPSKYTIKLKEHQDFAWTEAHNLNVNTGTLNEKALLYMDLGTNWDVKAVLSFLEPIRETVANGRDYKLVKMKGTRNGKPTEKDCLFVKFKNVKAAMICSLMIGDIAGDGCFLKSWAQTPFFNSQFINETGVHNEVTIYWVEPNRWKATLQNKLNSFLKCGENFTKGFMRDEMSRARFNTAILSENRGWVRTEPKFQSLPNHFANILDSRLVDNADMKPEGIQKTKLEEMIQSGAFVLTNRYNRVIRFYKGYNHKAAEKVVEVQNQRAAAEQQNVNDNKQCTATRKLKLGDMSKVKLNNRFLRPNDTACIPHPKWSQIFDGEKWGTYSKTDLFYENFSREYKKNPVCLTELKKNATMEEFQEAQMWAMGGINFDDNQLALLKSMRDKHIALESAQRTGNMAMSQMIAHTFNFAKQTRAISDARDELRERQINFLVQNSKLSNERTEIMGHDKTYNKGDINASRERLKRRLKLEEDRGGKPPEMIKAEDIIEGNIYLHANIFPENIKVYKYNSGKYLEGEDAKRFKSTPLTQTEVDSLRKDQTNLSMEHIKESDLSNDGESLRMKRKEFTLPSGIDPRQDSESDGFSISRSVSTNSSNLSIYQTPVMNIKDELTNDITSAIGRSESLEFDQQEDSIVKKKTKKKTLLNRMKKSVTSMLSGKEIFNMGEAELKSYKFKTNIQATCTIGYQEEAKGNMEQMVFELPTEKDKKMIFISRIEAVRSWISIILSHGEHIIQLLEAAKQANNERGPEHQSDAMNQEIDYLVPGIQRILDTMKNIGFLPMIMEKGLEATGQARNYFPRVSTDMYEFIRKWLPLLETECRTTIKCHGTTQGLKSLIKRIHKNKSALSEIEEDTKLLYELNCKYSSKKYNNPYNFNTTFSGSMDSRKSDSLNQTSVHKSDYTIPVAASTPKIGNTRDPSNYVHTPVSDNLPKCGANQTDISTPEARRAMNGSYGSQGELFVGDNIDLGHADFSEILERSEIAVHRDSSSESDLFRHFFEINGHDCFRNISPCTLNSTENDHFLLRPNDTRAGQILVQILNENLLIGNEEIDENHPLGEYNFEPPSNRTPIGTIYKPKPRNERIFFQYNNHCFRNPTYPIGQDIQIINDNMTIRTKLRRKKVEKKPLPNFKLSCTYTNINPPILNKLSTLAKTYHLSSILAISEVRTKRKLILDNSVLPLNMTAYIHRETNSELVYAMIVTRNILGSEISIIFDEPPFIAINVKTTNCNMAIACFYRPHNESVIYDRDFTRQIWEERFERCVKSVGKLSAIYMGDLNIDLENPCSVNKDLAERIENYMAKFNRTDTGNTFRRNNDIYTRVDYIWTKGLTDVKMEKANGRITIGNDGHEIFNMETIHNVSGSTGTMTITRRPKLIPEVVNRLGSALYNDLNSKLNRAANTWYEKIEYGPYNPLTKAFDYDNNDYCEKALDFFEKLFNTLQPETEKTVRVYNNKRHYSNNVTSLTIILASLDQDLLDISDRDERSKIKKMMKKLIRVRERYKRADDRRAILGRNRVNDDDIFAITKALRPKLRGIQMSREIFSAQELANEFVRVYNGITDHIKYSTERFNLIDLLPRIDDALRFSFKDYCPTWNNSLAGVKNIQQCFRQLKPVTRGRDSSLYRDGMIHLPAEYTDIIDNMIFYWVHNGNYPERFLTGKLKAILKKGNPLEIKNRRFISVGHMFQQLLGKIVASCLLAFFEGGFLHQKQFGFRKGRSTELAVAHLNLMVNSRHSTVMTYLFLLDLSSAFFCVKKKQLIELLSLYLDKNSLEFFKKMLRPRKAIVISNGDNSEPIDVPDDGVPQGEACSPLFFILIINEIFNYVPTNMNDFYEKLGIWLQGFADDSLLSIYATSGWQKLIDDAFKRTNDFVETVGFKMNPSKTECIVFGNKDKRIKAGDSVNTPIGKITIEEQVNILGLRVDQNFSFLPQFLHVMKKLKGVQICILELIGMGTSRQILKVGFSKSCGIYLYGIGIQPKWTEKQYHMVQAEVLKAIRRIYGIKWNRENSWSQNDILRMANWPPVRIQHAKMSLLLLNKTLMNRNIDTFNEIIDRHLKTGNGRNFMRYQDRIRNFEIDPLADTWLPRFVVSREQSRQMSTKVWKAFPFNTNYWLVRLPAFIRILLGTKTFEKAMILHFRLSCWHRTDKSCSICKNTVRIYPGEVRRYKDLLQMANQTLELTEEEIEEQSTEEIQYLRNIDRSVLDESDSYFDE